MKSSTELRKELREAIKREKAERLSKFGPHKNADWVPDPSKVTPEQAIQLKAKRDCKGLNRDALSKIGVPWPPPPNWKNRLIKAAKDHHGINDLNKLAAEIRKTNRIGIISLKTFEPPVHKRFVRHDSRG